MGSFVNRISLGGIITFFSCLLGVATNNLHCIMIPHSVGQVSIEQKYFDSADLQSSHWQRVELNHIWKSVNSEKILSSLFQQVQPNAVNRRLREGKHVVEEVWIRRRVKSGGSCLAMPMLIHWYDRAKSGVGRDQSNGCHKDQTLTWRKL